MRKLVNDSNDRLYLLKNKNCVAYKINIRTLDTLKPILKFKNSWLTIGDYNGFEAKYFSENNQNVLATDISDSFLKAAKTQGLISDFRKIIFILI